LSSDQLAEQAHQLYLAGRYEEALDLLRAGVQLFPLSAELHLGIGYARLAREEYAWARPAFEEALTLEPHHEDALAGMGETLLKLGQPERGLACFHRILGLGFGDDHDLMLQVGRALFREGVFDQAHDYFARTVKAHAESAEAVACLGYAAHRLGDDGAALDWLRRAVELDPQDTEARIYLGNLLYDRGEYEEALFHFGQTTPEDHVEELALWRMVELKKTIYRMEATDPELLPWVARFRELAETITPEDRILAEVEATLPDGSVRDPRQLDFFATLLTELHGMKRRSGEMHRVALADGTMYIGTWDDIVLQMKQDDGKWAGGSISEYMADVARKSSLERGVNVPITDAESFIRGIAEAGFLKIMR
jgi:tetratricopeptide (TPR) repeat protein